MYNVTTKLEIDVMSALDLMPSIDMAIKYRMNTLVIHPDLMTDAIFARVRKQGKFKIITPVDWPKGDVFGMNKMTGMTKDALSADGFEIIISARDNSNEIKSEALAITDFVRRHLGQHIQVRFVLATSVRDPQMISKICDVMKHIPAPNVLRTDIHTKIQQTKAEHTPILENIRKSTALPVKISGNINSLKIVQKYLSDVHSFGVSLKQAEAIIAELKKAEIEQATATA